MILRGMGGALGDAGRRALVSVVGGMTPSFGLTSVVRFPLGTHRHCSSCSCVCFDCNRFVFSPIIPGSGNLHQPFPFSTRLLTACSSPPKSKWTCRCCDDIAFICAWIIHSMIMLLSQVRLQDQLQIIEFGQLNHAKRDLLAKIEEATVSPRSLYLTCQIRTFPPCCCCV